MSQSEGLSLGDSFTFLGHELLHVFCVPKNYYPSGGKHSSKGSSRSSREGKVRQIFSNYWEGRLGIGSSSFMVHGISFSL
jgi:hypothetical protein